MLARRLVRHHPSTAPDAPADCPGVLFFAQAMFVAVDWLYSKVPVGSRISRSACPKVESVGWPVSSTAWITLRYQDMYGTWTGEALNPREVFQRNFWHCAIDDTSAFALRERIGVDRILLEADYPHCDTTWPDTQERLWEQIRGCTPEEIEKMAWRNRPRCSAIRCRSEFSRIRRSSDGVAGRQGGDRDRSRSRNRPRARARTRLTGREGRGERPRLHCRRSTVRTRRRPDRDLIIDRGGEAVANYDDVADFAAAGRLVDQAIEQYGRLDVLVNNAGIARDSMIFNMTEEAWDAVIRVHLKGTFAPTHHAAVYWRREFKAGRAVAGRVINTTSGAGVFGNAGQANYATAKTGLIGFTQTVSVELRRLGVTVNCISPSGTTRIAATIPTAGIPVKEPDDYDEFDMMDPSSSSPVVAWLASDEASHMTGQVIRAYGDRMARVLPLGYGPELDNGGCRWTADEVGRRVNMDIFGNVTRGCATESVRRHSASAAT